MFRFCTRLHMHMCLLWNSRDDVTHSKYIGEHLLWAFHFAYMPLCLGLSDSLVCMSQCRDFFTFFFHFSCATKVEVLKTLFQCFEPERLLLLELEGMQTPRVYRSWGLEIKALQRPFFTFVAELVPNSFSP